MLPCKVYKREKNNGGFFKMLHSQPQEMECFLFALVDSRWTDVTSTMNHIPNLERHFGSYGVIRYDGHPQSRQCYKKTTNKLCKPQLRVGCGPLENGHVFSPKNMKPWFVTLQSCGGQSSFAPEWTHHHKPWFSIGPVHFGVLISLGVLFLMRMALDIIGPSSNK